MNATKHTKIQSVKQKVSIKTNRRIDGLFPFNFEFAHIAATKKKDF